MIVQNDLTKKLFQDNIYMDLEQILEVDIVAIVYNDTTQLGLVNGTTYFIIAPVATNTFTLSATPNGASLSLTNGAGLSLDYYPVDPSMNRVEALFNSSFDFGKPYVAKAASTVGGNTGGGVTDFNTDNASAGGSDG